MLGLMRLIVGLLLVPTALLSAQEATVLELEREFEDWHFVDLDEDGFLDVLFVYASTAEGRPVAVAWGSKKEEFSLGPQSLLPRDTSAFAFGKFAGKKFGMVALSRASFSLWQRSAKGALEQVLQQTVEAPSLFRAPPRGKPSIWSWPTDVDGDGLDDLFVPVDRGIALFKSRQGGGFEKEKVLPLPGTRRIGPDGGAAFLYERELPSPVFVDLDGDGRMELAWFDEKGLGYLSQGKDGSFDTKNPRSFELPWLAPEEGAGVLEQTDIALKDLDGDKKADLLLSRMRSKAGQISDMESTLVILKNRGGDEPFPRTPSTLIRMKGIVGFGPSNTDINGDGAPDLVIGTYGARLSDAVSRFLGHVPVVMHVYAGQSGEDSPFETAPALERKLRVSVKDYDEWGAKKAAYFEEDLTGDGRKDLLLLYGNSKGVHTFSMLPGKGRGKSFDYAEKSVFKYQARELKSYALRSLAPKGPLRLVVIRKSALEIVPFPRP